MLDFSFCISSTATFYNFDLSLNAAYAAIIPLFECSSGRVSCITSYTARVSSRVLTGHADQRCVWRVRIKRGCEWRMADGKMRMRG